MSREVSEPKEFDLGRIGPNDNVVVIGQRGSGKTVLLSNILAHYGQNYKIDRVLGMSPTRDTLSTLQKDLSHLPETSIDLVNDFEEDKLEGFLHKALYAQKDDGLKDLNQLVILDECMYNRKAMNSASLCGLFLNGRCLRVGGILSMQYHMDLRDEMRANVDYVFVAHNSHSDTAMKLWRHFFGVYPSYGAFREAYDSLKHHEFLVLDNRLRTNALPVFRFKPCLDPWPQIKPCNQEEELREEQKEEVVSKQTWGEWGRSWLGY